tara:strand:+ start:1564 stop:2589 length:1026 start_codon:yes stop_codon:yes gene_type:complete
MSYIGQGLPADTFQGYTTDSFTGDGSATTFTLSKQPFSENSLIVVINNVIQKPTTNFTVSGTTLTIVGTAVASGDVIYAIHTGGVLPIGEANRVDLNGASDQLILDADADTTISADTDDQIDFKVGGTDQIKLTDGVLAPTTTNDVDLGSTSLRFKDVAISNDIAHLDNAGTGRTLYDRSANMLGNTGTNLTAASLYVGGTGSANQLDDYEEGTWTPTFSDGFYAMGSFSIQSGRYVKVGRQVFIQMYIATGASGWTSNGNQIVVNGLPFTTTNDSSIYNRGFGGFGYSTMKDSNGHIITNSDATSFKLYRDGYYSFTRGSNHTGGNNETLICGLVYETTA